MCRRLMSIQALLITGAKQDVQQLLAHTLNIVPSYQFVMSKDDIPGDNMAATTAAAMLLC